MRARLHVRFRQGGSRSTRCAAARPSLRCFPPGRGYRNAPPDAPVRALPPLWTSWTAACCLIVGSSANPPAEPHPLVSLQSRCRPG
eukprot:15483190-Alexandrium_andersonii.AAC.1